MAKLRLFIAVPISDQARDEIENLVQLLRPESSGVRWVKPGNLHLTLKFLGDVEASKLESLRNSLDSCGARQNRYQFELSDTGCFPNCRRPRVLWVGIEEGSDRLIKTQRIVDEELSKINFPKEKRRFTPHLTIARLKTAQTQTPWLTTFREYKLNRSQTMVSEILLMKSDLKPGGAEYTCLHKAGLH